MVRLGAGKVVGLELYIAHLVRAGHKGGQGLRQLMLRQLRFQGCQRPSSGGALALKLLKCGRNLLDKGCYLLTELHRM